MLETYRPMDDWQLADRTCRPIPVGRLDRRTDSKHVQGPSVNAAKPTATDFALTVPSMLESANLALGSANYSINSSTDLPRIDVWVQALWNGGVPRYVYMLYEPHPGIYIFLGILQHGVIIP